MQTAIDQADACANHLYQRFLCKLGRSAPSLPLPNLSVQLLGELESIANILVEAFNNKSI